MDSKQQPPPYPLRMPPETREQLEAMAASNKRSLNAEIVDRLQQSFSAVEGLPLGNALNALAVSVAKSEADAARVAVNAEALLFRGATLASVLLRVLKIADSKGIELLEKEERATLRKSANELMAEASEHTDAAFERVLARAEEADRQLKEATKVFKVSTHAKDEQSRGRVVIDRPGHLQIHFDPPGGSRTKRKSADVHQFKAKPKPKPEEP